MLTALVHPGASLGQAPSLCSAFLGEACLQRSSVEWIVQHCHTHIWLCHSAIILHSTANSALSKWYHMHTLCAYCCTELNYAVLDTDFSPYLFVAVLFLVLVLPLPLLLLYYPCVPALMQHVTKRSPQSMTSHKFAPCSA